MNKFKGLVAISAFSLLILGLPAIASAQWNGGYGNGGYGNGGYGNNGYGYNIKSTVKNLKDRAKRFENEVDRYDNNNGRYNRGGYGNGGYGGYGGYGNNNYGGDLESLANQFKDATDDLEDAYGNGRNMNNSANEARRVLDIASAIDREIYNVRGNGNLQGQWNSLRNDLNMLANAYGYNNNNNRYPGNNRNNRRNGNWRNNIPFPLPF